MSDFEFPADLRYTSEHEWVRQDGDRIRIGITSYAQDALGDIVFVTLPEVGADVTAGHTCGEVESTKSVSDIYSPVTGSVLAVNPALDATPELVNSDPYGEGWMFEITAQDSAAVAALMTAEQYRGQLG
jgi:glycine cleavage system H protein